MSEVIKIIGKLSCSVARFKFAGTGKISDIGCGRGKYHTVNVPLKEAINDQQYFDVFSR